MLIHVSETIDPEVVEPAWHTYLAAFDELRIKAVHRQVMYRHEFDEMIADQPCESHARAGFRLLAAADEIARAPLCQERSAEVAAQVGFGPRLVRRLRPQYFGAPGAAAARDSDDRRVTFEEEGRLVAVLLLKEACGVPDQAVGTFE